MNYQARGTFDVVMKPVGEPDVMNGVALGKLALDKQFHGDLVAVSKGQMLTALTGVDGSAGYVAIERVTGALNGQQGSFVFQHAGLMSRGAQQVSISVVPDSGTEQLTGIAGAFSLNVVDGEHFYAFEYSLPESALNSTNLTRSKT
jgi:hypothetical protein